MSGRWFRFYDEAINDPKVLRMSPEMRWNWVAVLCIASQSKGKIPADEDVSLLLRTTVSQASEIIGEFVSRGLLDKTRDGFHEPHNWRRRQYKSDLSTPRVKQFRKRFKAVSATPPEADTEQTTEAETEKKTSLRSGKDRKSKTVSVLEEVLDETRAAAVVEHRAKLRKPLTTHGAKLLAGKFAACADANAAADAMIANGWQGFDPGWLTNGSRAPPQRSSGPDAMFRAAAKLMDEMPPSPEIANGQLKLLK